MFTPYADMSGLLPRAAGAAQYSRPWAPAGAGQCPYPYTWPGWPNVPAIGHMAPAWGPTVSQRGFGPALRTPASGHQKPVNRHPQRAATATPAAGQQTAETARHLPCISCHVVSLAAFPFSHVMIKIQVSWPDSTTWSAREQEKAPITAGHVERYSNASTAANHAAERSRACRRAVFCGPRGPRREQDPPHRQ